MDTNLNSRRPTKRSNRKKVNETESTSNREEQKSFKKLAEMEDAFRFDPAQIHLTTFPYHKQETVLINYRKLGDEDYFDDYNVNRFYTFREQFEKQVKKKNQNDASPNKYDFQFLFSNKK